MASKIESITAPKDLLECVYVLQNVTSNLSKCIQNLSAKRLEAFGNTNAETTINDGGREALLPDNYRTMMSPQDWDVLMKKNMPDDSTIDFDSFQNQLSSTRKPHPNIINSTNTTQHSAQMQGANPNSISTRALNSLPNSSYVHSQCTQDTNNLHQHVSNGQRNASLLPWIKKTPALRGNQEKPNEYTTFDGIARQRVAELESLRSFCNSFQIPLNYDRNNSTRNNHICNREDQNEGKSPYLQLDDIINDIDSILKMTKNSIFNDEATAEAGGLQKIQNKGNFLTLPNCSSKSDEEPNHKILLVHPHMGMSYLICNLNKLVTNQKRQIRQFENVIETLKKSEISDKAGGSNETLEAFTALECRSTESCDKYDVNLLAEVIFNGFFSIVKTLLTFSEAKADCEQLEFSDKNKAVVLQNNVVGLLRSLIGSIEGTTVQEKSIETAEMSEKARDEDESGIQADAEPSVEVEIKNEDGNDVKEAPSKTTKCANFF